MVRVLTSLTRIKERCMTGALCVYTGGTKLDPLLACALKAVLMAAQAGWRHLETIGMPPRLSRV